ncbi:MAG: hypothetical protein ACKOB1_02315 [Planctomycetia bacterium]
MNRFAWIAILGGLVAFGCKSDISQQLLERELRMQEDQIYLLQDEVQENRARLEHVAAENRSLKKQLGIVDADASLPSRIDVPPAVAAPARGPTPATPPALVPPAVSAPAVVAPPLTLPEPAGVPPVSAEPADGPRFGPPSGGAAPPAQIAPPALDGVPPLPSDPATRGASATSEIKRLSHEESLSAEGKITHLVINPGRTTCFDGDGDGTSDGLAIVFEPRDADERLVTAGGDVTITATDPAAPGGPEGAPLATWQIPSTEALAHFRRTSRARGLHFTLPWQGRPPAGDHVRLFVKLTTFDGQSFETDATVPAK